MALSLTTRLLHWIIAFAILGLLVGGKLVDIVPSPYNMQVLFVHISVGLCVALFLILRLANRLREGFPAPVTPQARALDLISRLTHWGLLIVPFLMIASGFMNEYAGGRDLHIFGIQVIPAMDQRDMALKQQAEHFHSNASTVLIVLILLHIAGAMKHAIIDKDGTLKRMIR